MANIAGRDITTADLAIMGTGALMVIASFLPWFGPQDDRIRARAEQLGVDVSLNAWSSTFLAWGAVVLAVVVAGLVAGRLFAGFAMPTTGKTGPHLLLLMLSGLGAALIVLRLLVGAVNGKAEIGLYLALVLAIVQAGFAFLSFRSSGEQLPSSRRPGSA